MPQDFGADTAIAVLLIFACWWGYSFVLSRLRGGPINAKLESVRADWIAAMTDRTMRPFDAILIGHITNALAFFGSATLIVLAGLISSFASIKTVHELVSELDFVTPVSLELFELQLGFVAVVLAISFFSFTYALRKLIYVIALIGALPHTSDNCPTLGAMVGATATVLSEAIKTFNFGIRGYYYAVSAVCLLASPAASIAVTIAVTAVLFYRQLSTRTSAAIDVYVEAAKSMPKRQM
ncbi:MAG: DUF599 domain-containing protein [Pseudomonadota bacterium]